MKLLTFYSGEKLNLGVKTAKGVLDISSALECCSPEVMIPATMEELIQAGPIGLSLMKDYVATIENRKLFELYQKEDDLTLGPCVPSPGKIIGIGLNYYGYLKLSDTPKPDFPYIFTKFPTAVRATKDPVMIPFNSEQVDFEAELAIVIGKKARNVSPEEALDYVMGYCNANDFSARDLQYSTQSWLPGKCCDGFCPIGPYLVTSDEVGDPNNLTLKAYLNGKLLQDSNTSDMIWKCNEIVSGITKFFTLEPGDIILTGTPEGIIMTFPEEERVWCRFLSYLSVEFQKSLSVGSRHFLDCMANKKYSLPSVSGSRRNEKQPSLSES